MFVLLGAMCMFSKLNCTAVGMIGRPYDSKLKCEDARHLLIKAIGPVEWLDGQFECVEDEKI